jgi:hypothetical protein
MTDLNNLTFFIIDAVIVLLLWRVERLLAGIERNTRHKK